MIPLIAALRFGARRALWIPVPLFIVWLLLLPLCLLALPVFLVACRANGMRAGRTLATFWALLSSLSGTHLEITHADIAFAVRLI